MTSIDLGRYVLLGPAFETYDAQSFRDFVVSLKQLKSMDKPPRPPRIKREKVSHDVPEGSKVCTRCGKKVKKPSALCPGPKKATSSENIVDEATASI